MPWFKVDDGLSGNKKFTRIPRAQRMSATGLWTTLGAWCARELTDGRVPKEMVLEVGGTMRQASCLVAAGLWVDAGSEFAFCNWHEYQPTKESVEAERAAAKERQQRARDKAKERREQEAVTAASQRDGGVTHAVTSPELRASSRSPRPGPSLKEVVVTSVGSISKQRGHEEPPDDGDSPSPTERVVASFADWLDATDQPRPPKAVRAALSAQVKSLLDEDIPAAHILAGLKLWQGNGKLGASALPTMVHEARSKPAGTTRRQHDTDVQFDRLLARAAEHDQQKAIGR